jgi:hypothetical protein
MCDCGGEGALQSDEGEVVSAGGDTSAVMCQDRGLPLTLETRRGGPCARGYEASRDSKTVTYLKAGGTFSVRSIPIKHAQEAGDAAYGVCP